MINLIPQHTKDLNYLYELVSERCKWFIKLRYIAIIMLSCFYVYIVFFNTSNVNPLQITTVLLILLSMFSYNLISDYISRKEIIKNDVHSFNPIKFALIQILLDLISLMILVYITGLINSPFQMFFIFHAIIGSLILPGSVVYFIVIIVLLIFSALNLLTHFGVIQEFVLSNSGSLIALNIDYLVLNLLAFWLMILLSVMFVNYLTSALYRREQQLIEAIQKIEESEIEKQKYIMAVVHEVKSPLSVIVSYLNLLISGIPEEINVKVKNILVKMKKRSDDAIELTNDILEVSRIKQLKDLNKEEFNPEEIIETVMDKVRDKAMNENINLNYTDKRFSGRKLFADKHLIEILLSNVISNSIKYNHNGGKSEVILSENENMLSIIVTDSGIGIPKDEIKSISNEFYRAGNAKKSKIEGTGLGMFVVNQIVGKHNGELKIESPSGSGNTEFPGTSIQISLPYS